MVKLIGEGGVLDKLYGLQPDYISCTYGAGAPMSARTWKFWMRSRRPASARP
jgi:hypothetical protein